MLHLIKDGLTSGGGDQSVSLRFRDQFLRFIAAWTGKLCLFFDHVIDEASFLGNILRLASLIFGLRQFPFLLQLHRINVFFVNVVALNTIGGGVVDERVNLPY
jgi:hypothetical protein